MTNLASDHDAVVVELTVCSHLEMRHRVGISWSSCGRTARLASAERDVVRCRRTEGIAAVVLKPQLTIGRRRSLRADAPISAKLACQWNVAVASTALLGVPSVRILRGSVPDRRSLGDQRSWVDRAPSAIPAQYDGAFTRVAA